MKRLPDPARQTFEALPDRWFGTHVSLLRDATHADLESIMDVQEEGAVLALAHIFPQDLHPFPRRALQERWASEIDNPAVRVLAIVRADRIAGFAALRGDQLLHFGTAASTWGTGLAAAAHAEIVRLSAGTTRLWVFTENHRARRFYDKMGWQPTGRTRRSTFAPRPELMEYARRTG